MRQRFRCGAKTAPHTDRSKRFDTCRRFVRIEGTRCQIHANKEVPPVNDKQSIRDELQSLVHDYAPGADGKSDSEVIADAILASPVIRRIQAEALRYWADEMDNTDDPDSVYVDNGDIELWLHAVADRIEKGEQP